MKNKKIIIITLAIFIAVALLGVAGFFAINTLKFTKVEYDNGKGDVFNLTFYRDYETIVLADKVDRHMKTLVSKVSKDDKHPIYINISSAEESSEESSERDCEDRNFGAVAMTIKIKSIDQYVKLCSVKEDYDFDQDILYFGLFRAQNKIYPIIVSQDIDVEEAVKSKENAQEAIATAGLEVYQDDIEKIISSIEIIK